MLSFRAAATLLSAVAPFGVLATGQTLSQAQIKQIEDIALSIATQHNAASSTHLDDVTVSSRATAVGRNVRFAHVLRVKKGLPASQLKAFADESRREIYPRACATNANNPAFARGLTYTFSYTSTHGDKLGEFTVDQAGCAAAK